ncbi:MAG TPA: NADH-quinone oxidoreductase subunit C [Candidatus Saccharimonadales bacterium]|nr:NADH-quinone oxidoreductase subunit C [Candidatus Saccharimonadales bacterium]
MKKYQEFLPKNTTVEYKSDRVVTFEVPAQAIAALAEGYLGKGLSLKLIDATDERKTDGCFKVWYVFGVPTDNIFIVPFVRVGEKTAEFPSISSITVGAVGYERKIRSFFGLKPAGNTDSRAMILHENWPEDTHPLRKDFDFDKRPAKAKGTPYEFQHVDGEGVYELPVGPIHAGIIEPGHFRFNLAGESIMLLEGRLGFVHKGTEKLFERLALADQVRLSEKISGDSSLSHSMAFCMAVEQLAGVKVPERAQYLRTIYAELERLAAHIGDIGFIMLDTGFNFGGANGARLREMIMRINERLTGSRFLRGVNTVGGVQKDLSKEQLTSLSADLAVILKDFLEVISVADDNATLNNRLRGTGPLAFGVVRDFGAVGVPARAVGIGRDARAEHPYAAYGKLPKQAVAVQETGDVYARFHVRIDEVKASVAVIQAAIAKIPSGAIAVELPERLKKNAVAVGCVEGWRGEIVHVVMTDAEGSISRVMVRDPSFINWQVVGYAGQGMVVPDFPLINKSFNLSYTGNDL